jgi:hypothetical protein
MKKSPYLILTQASVNPALEILQLAADIVLMQETSHRTHICPAIHSPPNAFQCPVTAEELPMSESKHVSYLRTSLVYRIRVSAGSAGFILTQGVDQQTAFRT